MKVVKKSSLAGKRDIYRVIKILKVNNILIGYELNNGDIINYRNNRFGGIFTNRLYYPLVNDNEEFLELFVDVYTDLKVINIDFGD